MKPRSMHRLAVVFRQGLPAALLGFLSLVGCANPLFRGQSPDPEELTRAEVSETPIEPKLIGDIVGALGMNYVTIEGIALVKNLSGTGSDPAPSPQRQHLIDEMQAHDVKNPNQVLADPNNSLVYLRAVLPPGVQQGDRLDVEVRVPPRSETTSLRGGWLMATRLREMQVLGGALRSGHVSGMAEGNILVDADYQESSDKVLQTRGRVLGGGVSMTTRKLGLAVRNEHSSIRTSTAIANTINGRFHTFDTGGKKVGVASPKRDNYLELALPPRYKHNVWRYVRVIRAMVIKESPIERSQRLHQLEQKLFEPTTSQHASLQLEGIGREAIPVLKKGLKASNPEIRFYAAEALAYLDEAEAAPALAEAARETPAFRWFALAGLRAMDHVSAYDALADLLHVASAETRYGAFRTIRERNPRDPLVQGEILGRSREDEPGATFVVVNTNSEPLIHFSKSQRAEIVLFGADQQLQLSPSDFVYAGPQIMLKPLTDGRIKVTRFQPGAKDRSDTCQADLAHVVPAIFRVGGSYSDAMQALLAAKKKDLIAARIAIDALPRHGRTYHRQDPDEESSSEERPADEIADNAVRSRVESERFQPDFNKSKDDSKKSGFMSKFNSLFFE